MQKGNSITLQEGTYTLLESLARGGQGTIWKVVDNKNLPYALKVANRYKIESSRKTLHTTEDMQRLIYYAKAEIDFLISLDNSLTQHIVVCLDHGTIRQEGYDLPAFIMPFYQQEDLSLRIKSLRDKDESISPQLWLRWFRQLMLALQSIQIASKNNTLLVHRDIKPANCLLDDDNNLLLIDFGIVRENSKTGTTSIVYAYGYCAPEQRLACYETDKGEPHYYITPAVDIYSAAALMYEVVAGGRQAQRELNDDRTKRLHDRALHRLNEKPKDKVGKLGKVGGLNEKEQLNLQHILVAIFSPKNSGKTMVLSQPALPHYQQVGEDAAQLIADMLAPWPNDRPDVNTVLQRLDKLEATLKPELQQLSFSKEKRHVFVGQDLLVDFIVKGKGLPSTLDWLQISLDQTPLEKPLIKAISTESFQLILPVFSELRPYHLRLSTQLFGQDYSDSIRIDVQASADYHWTMGERLEALKIELRLKWLDQWEGEAKDVVDKYPLLAALKQLQQCYPEQSAELQARYKRINIVNDVKNDPLPVKKIAAVILSLSVITTLGINWDSIVGKNEMAGKKTILIAPIPTPLKPSPISVKPDIKQPDLTTIKAGFQSEDTQVQRKAWRALKEIITENKEYKAAIELKENYENQTAKWNKKDDSTLRKHAFTRLTAMAEEGDKKAQYLLALRYLDDKNMLEGKRWTKKAAAQGHGTAIKTLKLMESRPDLF